MVHENLMVFKLTFYLGQCYNLNVTLLTHYVIKALLVKIMIEERTLMSRVRIRNTSFLLNLQIDKIS
jgi:hypothetical protein